MVDLVTYFSLNGVGVTTLSPTIDGYRVLDSVQTFAGQTMSHIAAGFYKYGHTLFSRIVPEVYLANAGTDSVDARYQPAAFTDPLDIADKIPPGNLSDFDESLDAVELLDSGGGAGTSANELVTDIGSDLSGTHGVGSWATATGFAIPGSTMAVAVASQDSIVDKHWDEQRSGHNADGSFGQSVRLNASGLTTSAVSEISADIDSVLSGTHGAGSWATATGFAIPGSTMAVAVASQDSIVDKVFDEPRAGHTQSLTFGETIINTDAGLLRALGLVQENQFIDNTSFVDGNMTGGRLRIYSSAASVGTTNNVLATYIIASTYDANDNLVTYKMTRV